MVMDKRKIWLKKGLCIGGGGFVISSLTSGVLWAAVHERIVLSPIVWVGVQVLIIIASLCLLASLALVVRVFTLKG
jgi:hypothetical protein